MLRRTRMGTLPLRSLLLTRILMDAGEQALASLDKGRRSQDFLRIAGSSRASRVMKPTPTRVEEGQEASPAMYRNASLFESSA
jgi:hypothetical protein